MQRPNTFSRPQAATDGRDSRILRECSPSVYFKGLIAFSLEGGHSSDEEGTEMRALI